jgi:putative ABC transport system permease protein
MSRFVSSVRVGWLLGLRQIRHSNIWVTVLIIAILMLTFLSNVLTSGLLIGIIEGGNRANRDQYTGDVFVTELPDESFVENTAALLSTLDRLDEVKDYTARYVAGATVEANYQTRRNFNTLPNSVGLQVAGIDPIAEDTVTHLSDYLIEGEYLDPSQSGYILIGATLLERHSAFSDQFEPLRDVYPGDRVKLSVNSGSDNTVDEEGFLAGEAAGSRVDEFIVKGIIDSKVGEVSIRAFMTESDFRRLTGRNSLLANEVAVELVPGVTDEVVKDVLMKNGFDEYAKIQTAEEAIPKFLDDIKQTFTLIGALIGFIVSVVGAITIFIVIYINAVVRRKQIGILKGIGVRRNAIIYSYIFQAVVYAVIGVVLALLLVYLVFVPFVAQNPIDFPFSDGIIAADIGLVMNRIVIVAISTLLAGFLPAWLIVRGNTLNSILGR